MPIPRQNELGTVAVLSICWALALFDITGIDFLMPFIASGLKLDNTQIGLLFSLYWLPFGASSYITGEVDVYKRQGGSLPGSIKLPGYTLVKAGAYGILAGVRADLYVDNVMDRRYFIAEYDVDSNASVLPGVGREWHLKLSKRF